MDNKNLPTILRSGNFLEAMSDKSYDLPDEQIKYHRAYFAFIDILGFKNLLTSHGEEAPKIIFKIIKNSYLFHKSSYETIKLKVLSDSILIWSETDHQIAFWNLINVVDLLRDSFLKNGLLVRGGVSVGNNFIHNDIIVSPSLSEAYLLEQRANFPRILISKEAAERGLKDLRFNGLQYGVLHENYFRVCNRNLVLKDFDNEFILAPFLSRHGIDCLQSGVPSWHSPGDAPLTKEQLETIQKAGIQALMDIRSELLKTRPPKVQNEKIAAKHNYVSELFNKFIEKSGVSDKVEKLPRLSAPSWLDIFFRNGYSWIPWVPKK